MHLPLLLLLPITIHGCLKVQTPEPPKCECPYLAMNSATTYDTVRNHPFYGNISSVPRIAPLISTDDCSTSLYCEGDYSLVIFDTETASVFGAFSADGLCDPYTQKWHVEDGTGLFKPFDRLYGVCVEYKTIEPIETTTARYDSCPCQVAVLSNDVDVDRISYHPFIIYNKLVLDVSPPNLYNYSESCPSYVDCNNGQSALSFITPESNIWAGRGATLVCKQDKTWELYQRTYPYLFITCSDFISTPPEPEGTCFCRSEPIYDASVSGYKLNNFQLKSVISTNKCSWEIGCRVAGKAQIRVNGPLFLGDKFYAECNNDVYRWKIFDETREWNNQDKFEFACVTENN